MQRRAKFALEAVQKAKQDNGVDQKEYKSYATAFPTMIHMNGLGQAVAFYRSKGSTKPTYQMLYDTLSEWLTGRGQPYAGKDNLLSGITEEDVWAYRLVGGFIFFDAIPIEPPTLAADIMTPHMGDWYAHGHTIEDVVADYKKIPADWHDPVPVPFLVVQQATLLFAIAPRTPAYRAGLAEAMDALSNALRWLGAGAKTAVGYGRMNRSSLESLDEGTLAKMFTKDFAAMQRKYGEGCHDFLDRIVQRYGDVIDSWASATKKTDKSKVRAYRNINDYLQPPDRRPREPFSD